tara:strand:- start:1205 stop:1525 length:321 start_codon:yes stop_codon:yes gene_type:complete
MAYNPKTYDLMQQIDISNALEKAVSYLENTEKDNASISIKSEKPFALYMRFKKYIKAFRVQMADVENVISNKYDQLLIQHDTIGIKLSSILEKDELQIVTESGEQL